MIELIVSGGLGPAAEVDHGDHTHDASLQDNPVSGSA